MQQYLTNLLDQTSWPLMSTLLLGLITSLGPCTLLTNITAIGFIAKDAENQRKVFWGGLVYTAGLAFSYMLLAVVLFAGASMLNLSGFFSRIGEKLSGPLLVFIGLVMLDLVFLKFPSFSGMINRLEQRTRKSFLDIFLLGTVFAITFCSYSGVMYFGILIPMTIKQTAGLYLPVFFALGSGLPVILFSWLMAFAFSGVHQWFGRIRDFEKKLRRTVAFLFIGAGIYRIIEAFL